MAWTKGIAIMHKCIYHSIFYILHIYTCRCIDVQCYVSPSQVLRLHGEQEAVPRLRAEYLSLKRLEKVEQRGAAGERGRQGLADALLERRAAEASQPSVMSMAMDWLWSGGVVVSPLKGDMVLEVKAKA